MVEWKTFIKLNNDCFGAKHLDKHFKWTSGKKIKPQKSTGLFFLQKEFLAVILVVLTCRQDKEITVKCQGCHPH